MRGNCSSWNILHLEQRAGEWRQEGMRVSYWRGEEESCVELQGFVHACRCRLENMSVVLCSTRGDADDIGTGWRVSGFRVCASREFGVRMRGFFGFPPFLHLSFFSCRVYRKHPTPVPNCEGPAAPSIVVWKGRRNRDRGDPPATPRTRHTWSACCGRFSAKDDSGCG